MAELSVISRISRSPIVGDLCSPFFRIFIQRGYPIERADMFTEIRMSVCLARVSSPSSSAAQSICRPSSRSSTAAMKSRAGIVRPLTSISRIKPSWNSTRSGLLPMTTGWKARRTRRARSASSTIEMVSRSCSDTRTASGLPSPPASGRMRLRVMVMSAPFFGRLDRLAAAG